MPKGFGGGMPGNMNNLVKQAQKMQQKVAQMQEELEARMLEVTSGGGAVRIVVTGGKKIESIELSKDVVDPDDVEMLQDLLLTAVNEALRQADEMVSREMGSLGLPGMPGLF